MSVTSQFDRSKQQMLIHVSGRFDFSQHTDFRKAMNDTSEGCGFIIDLCNTDYMDSSALGLLLLLRKKAGKTPVELRFKQHSVIEKILLSSNFSRLFTLTAKTT